MNGKSKTIKLPIDNIGEYLYEFCVRKNFLNKVPKHLPVKKKKVEKGDYIKIKNICSLKYPTERGKRQASKWEQHFAMSLTNKGFISRTYKEFLQIYKSKRKQK